MRDLCARLVAALLLLAPAAGAQEPQDPAKYEAGKKAFAAGVALLQDPEGARYDDALVQFRKAYELTSSFKALGNMALCLFKLERDGEAIAAYEKYLQVVGNKIDASERAQIERDLLALKAQVVIVKLELPEAGATVIDERPDSRGNKIVNEYAAAQTTLELGVHPGRHTLTARTSKGESHWEVKLDPATTSSHTFAIEGASSSAASGPAPTAAGEPSGAAPAAAPLEQPSGPDLRVPAYASFGVAAVGIGVGTVFALKSHGTRKDADALCNGDQCPIAQRDEIQSLQKDANNQGRIAFIGFVVGGVGVAAGVTMLIVGGGKKKENPEHAYVAPFISAGSAGLQGRF